MSEEHRKIKKIEVGKVTHDDTAARNLSIFVSILLAS